MRWLCFLDQIQYDRIFRGGGGIVFLAAYAEKSQWKEIRSVLLGVFSGVGIMTLPVMIYFASNHALADLFRVYFYDNIFYYSYKPYLINKLYYCAHNLVHSVRDNPALWMMIAAGLCWFTIRLKDKKEFLFLLICRYDKNKGKLRTDKLLFEPYTINRRLLAA